jgi:hypothetical protein
MRSLYTIKARARRRERLKMAKAEATKRAKMMRKEWWKSKSTEAKFNDLVELGVLHNQELAGWRLADGDSYPNP